jgi:hypothetical protein
VQEREPAADVAGDSGTVGPQAPDRSVPAGYRDLVRDYFSRD